MGILSTQFLTILAVSVCWLPNLTCLGQLDQKQFESLHAELNPVGEAWKSIPWETSMVKAQQKAAQQGKFLFIWAMDGNPLGCT